MFDSCKIYNVGGVIGRILPRFPMYVICSTGKILVCIQKDLWERTEQAGV